MQLRLRRRRAATNPCRNEDDRPSRIALRIAILIASKDGEATVGATVRSAVGQGDVYVVSDGSSDGTVQTAAEAGARVFQLAKNVGKPAALYRALKHFELTSRYDAVAILDDDTIIAADFIERARKRLVGSVVVVVGRTITRWDHKHRWNIWLAARAYAYWRYQVTLRRGQSALNVMNCISGSNSVYRSSLLDQVVVEQTPYIVDDTWWTLETQRRKLGRIVYEPSAHAWICDPLNMRDWYKQNLRWIWGMFQGIHGHKIGRKPTWFDLWSALLIADWTAYVLGFPVFIAAVILLGWWTPWMLLGLVAGNFAWTALAALATRKWRLVVLTPAIVLVDVLYRAIFIHAFFKAIRQPRVATCTWASPARY